MSSASHNKKRKRKPEEEAEDQSKSQKKEPSDLQLENEYSDNTDWSLEDMEELLERVEQVLPKTDVMMHSRRLNKIDWEKVKFGQHSAHSCSSYFSTILKKTIQKQTMLDLVQTTKRLYKRQPAVFQKAPKMPPGPYILFSQKMRRKIAKKHPEMSFSEINKLVGQKFRNLSPSKMEKYTNTYEANMELYKEELRKFKQDNPMLMDKPKCKTPSSIYIEHKVTKLIEEQPELSKKEARDIALKKWKKLKDKKKKKWIARAEEHFEDYKVECETWMRTHQDFQPRKSCLNQDETRIKYNKPKKDHLNPMLSKLQKPPQNGYSLFRATFLPTITDVSLRERLSELNRRWKALREEEKGEYVKKAKLLAEQYVEYRRKLEEKYDDRLPPFEYHEYCELVSAN